MTERNEHHTFKADEIPSQEISDPATLSKNPLVSVVTVTYNHEKYIAQCLDGAVMQRTDFDFEILIGEDDSSDNTREICKEYAATYPDKIRLFLNDRKNVIYINGRPTGRWNFINLLRNARGKYIAICEGDDYWTDPLKLQKQVDFLEANPDYGMVHSDNSNYYQHTKQLKYSHKEEYYPNPPSGWVFNDLVKKNFISTLTVVVRTPLLIEIIQYILDYIDKELIIDYFYWLEVSTRTKIKYLDNVIAVYRISNDTMSRPNSQTGKVKWVRNIYDIQKYFCNKYDCSDALKKQIKLNYYRDLLKFSLNNKNITLGREAITEIKKTSDKLTFKDRVQFFGCYNFIFYIISKVILKIFKLSLFNNSSLQV